MPLELRLLVVDDSEDDANLLVRELKRAGFVPIAKRVASAEAMAEALKAGPWDAVSCDYMMPGFSIAKALEVLHASGLDLPFIIVSGKIGEETAVEAMKAGAHDYVMKDHLGRLAPALKRELEDAKLRRERRQAALEQQAAERALSVALESAIAAMAATVEMRDPYTAGHQKRAGELAGAIAAEMGLPEERVHGVRLAGTVHDLGKISVPSEVLNKPGRLNDLEMNLIKLHARAGHDILKDIRFPWPIARIVLEHHERLDGSGYPQGLKGDEILLDSRILAVADVVEAMASHRPYRAGLGLQAALKEIADKRGEGFEPAAVDACLRLFQEKRFAFGEAQVLSPERSSSS